MIGREVIPSGDRVWHDVRPTITGVITDEAPAPSVSSAALAERFPIGSEVIMSIDGLLWPDDASAGKVYQPAGIVLGISEPRQEVLVGPTAQSNKGRWMTPGPEPAAMATEGSGHGSD